VLIAALNDPDPLNRASAAAKLGDRGAAKATPAVVQALADAVADADDKYLDTRINAAEALGKFGPVAQAAVPALKKAGASQNQYVRAAATEALKKVENAASGKR
jgi:HEAT repeat protein